MANAIHTTRRSLLASLPALGLAPAAAMSATAQDPVPEYFRRWKEAMEAWNQHDEATPESAHLWDEHCRFEKLLCTTRPTTMAGLIAQIEFILHPQGLGDYALGNMWEDLDRKLVENMVAGAKEMAA
ncbi:hypothetical protein [Tranquillimonas alkanivorans]|uniref:Uncharacterized protein n=1 Tax=Tranquillimonas alkanivorans TaxID=441119 RepID=A0A1I5L1F6_9RHOB|nr:hypothetical protein [Tranquillimonas alkanivorans]SFO91154.1 hypothetical protein SAMN04488047_101415 [Tranquillimonas alkanivorans]